MHIFLSHGEGRHIFHVFPGHPYALFGEAIIHNFCSIFIGLFAFFLLTWEKWISKNKICVFRQQTFLYVCGIIPVCLFLVLNLFIIHFLLCISTAAHRCFQVHTQVSLDTFCLLDHVSKTNIGLDESLLCLQTIIF
jgi:hypothetical protein